MLHVATTCRVLNKYFSSLSLFCVVYSLVFLEDANSTQNFLAKKSLNEWKDPTIFFGLGTVLAIESLKPTGRSY